MFTIQIRQAGYAGRTWDQAKPSRCEEHRFGQSAAPADDVLQRDLGAEVAQDVSVRQPKVGVQQTYFLAQSGQADGKVHREIRFPHTTFA